MRYLSPELYVLENNILGTSEWRTTPRPKHDCLFHLFCTYPDLSVHKKGEHSAFYHHEGIRYSDLISLDTINHVLKIDVNSLKVY